MEVKLIDHMGTDLTVVNAAKVSFSKQAKEWVPDEHKRLVSYLAKHRHMSPFGHCFTTFHVKAPIFVARQLVKHKFLRWNEVSRRYVDSEPEFYMPDKWRARPPGSVKQGSGDFMCGVLAPDSHTYALSEYNRLLDEGVAPEMARMVLPQNMYTEWYWSGSLDAFADMYNLRSKEDTQYESRFVANKIGVNMELLYPVSWRELTRDSV